MLPANRASHGYFEPGGAKPPHECDSLQGQPLDGMEIPLGTHPPRYQRLENARPLTPGLPGLCLPNTKPCYLYRWLLLAQLSKMQPINASGQSDILGQQSEGECGSGARCYPHASPPRLQGRSNLGARAALATVFREDFDSTGRRSIIQSETLSSCLTMVGHLLCPTLWHPLG